MNRRESAKRILGSVVAFLLPRRRARTAVGILPCVLSLFVGTPRSPKLDQDGVLERYSLRDNDSSKFSSRNSAGTVTMTHGNFGAAERYL